MLCVVSLCETLRLAIDDQADAALLPKLHLLDLVCGNVSKPRLLQKARELLVFRFIDCKFDKIHSCWLSNLWQVTTFGHHLGRWLRLLGHVDERTVGIACVAEGIARSELVVEDLQRKRPIKASGSQALHESLKVQFSLTWEAAVVTTPREGVHSQLGCVGHPNQKDSISGDVDNAIEFSLPGEDVEGVQRESE